MILRNKIVKTLENLLSNEAVQEKIKELQLKFDQRKQVSNLEMQKIKELESFIYSLGTKITILSDKVHELNNQIVNLSTLNEELLYIIDQGIEPQEDNEASLRVNSKVRKFELN